MLMIGAAVLIVVALSVARRSERGADSTAASASANSESVQQFCGNCHAYPPPDTFPRDAWKREVERGYALAAELKPTLARPNAEVAFRHYEQLAPLQLPRIEATASAGPASIEWIKLACQDANRLGQPTVTHLLWEPARASHSGALVSCDMAAGQVLRWDVTKSPPTHEVLAVDLAFPVRLAIADLDRDGLQDFLVANLGSYEVTDDLLGSVVWLRGIPDGTFQTIPLAEGLGRVADVQAADFDGDGNLDLVVAEFGWIKAGQVLLLENRGFQGDRPRFASRLLDPRHGAIHVPVTDLNQDGLIDFVALISQEHETVVAFVNAGGGRFQRHTIFTAPHPAFGCTGIQLVDLDGDTDLDLLLTNGDVLDNKLLRPYHGVSWLENRGAYPYSYRRIGDLYGASGTAAADFDLDGDVDVIASSFLPDPWYGASRAAVSAESIVLFEQLGTGTFRRHALDRINCDFPICLAVDVDGNQRPDLLLGYFGFPSGAQPQDPELRAPAVRIWRNLGRK